MGHFTRAAEELYLAQPSLSRQIAVLEAGLGQVLFERGPAGAMLTHAGEVLLPIARRILADAEAAAAEMDALAGLRRGRVRLGAPPTLCVSVVAEMLAGFRAEHPGVELEVMEAGSHTLAQALAEGRLDLALTVDRGPVPAGVSSEALFTEELVVAAARETGWDAGAGSGGHRQGLGRAALFLGAGGPAATGLAPQLLDGEPVTLAQLAAVPQVAFNRSYELRQATDAAFAAAGLSPVTAVEGAEMDAVLRFVERGIGVAVVPATILLGRPRLAGSRLVRPSLTRTVTLSSRTGGVLDDAARAMRALTLATVERLVAPGSELSALLTRA